MSFSVKVDTAKLDEIIAKLPGNRNRIIEASAKHILGQARMKAPHKTGELKRNSNVNMEYAYAGFINVEFYQEYAPYVELGTHNEDGSVRMKERPFLKPACEAEAKLLEKRLKDELITK